MVQLAQAAAWANLPNTSLGGPMLFPKARKMQERDVTLVCDRAAEAAQSEQPEQLVFERWLEEVSRFDVPLLVPVAVASVQYSFSFLSGAPWILEGAEPLLSPCFAWLEDRSGERALACAQGAGGWERLADAAERKSTDVGDWWTYGAIEHVAMIPTAIAVDAGIPLEPSNWPLGAAKTPGQFLTEVLVRFSWFPANVSRTRAQTLKEIADILRLVEREGMRGWDPFQQQLAKRGRK